MTTGTMTRPEFTVGAAAIASVYGIPVVESKAAQAHLKALKAAGKDGLAAALAEHGRALYSDTSALEADVKAAAEFVAQGQGVLDAATFVAVRIVMTARQVQPNVSASALGRSVEGVTLAEDGSVDKRAAAAQRKRWSRYVAAAQVVERRAAAVKAGTTDKSLSIRQALTALQNGYVPQAEILARAEDGRDMPTKGEAAAASKGDESKGTDDAPKPVSVATFVERLTALSDLSKRVQPSDWDDTSRAEVARLLANIASRVGVK